MYFFTVGQNLGPQTKDLIQFWATFAEYSLSWTKCKRFDVICLKKRTSKLEQLFFGQADFSEIHEFSKEAIFKDFGGLFKIHATGTTLGAET